MSRQFQPTSTSRLSWDQLRQRAGQRPNHQQLRRLALLLFGLLALVLVLLALSALFLVRRPWPQTTGTLTVPGLTAPVQVRRDAWGIPHIYAQNEPDLYLAQGYIHAQDRLWQMEFQRRVGQGRLSEILGESALGSDTFQRTLGTNRAAIADLANLPPATRALLDAYTTGVNSYLANQGSNLPLEFTILGYRPEPWRPEDSVVWSKMLQWDQSTNWNQELLRARLVQQLDAERAAQLLPSPGADTPLIVPSGTQSYRSLGTPSVASLRTALDRYGLIFDGSELSLGSNSWVVGSAKSATGHPLLANDPHLSIGLPSKWYLNGLHAPGLNVVGASLAGVPGVLIGHNQQLGWGLTTLAADIQDLYLERLNPQNPNEYEVDGTYQPFTIIREEIRVKDRAEPVRLDVRLTRHGPLLNDVVAGLDQPVALRWLATARPSTLIASGLQLAKATDWQSFTDALRLWDVPMMNFVYADTQGNIGYYGAGLVPIRAQGNGTLPAPGWDSSHEWTGFVPFDQLPQAFNPPEGYIATANNRPIGDDYPFHLGSTWAAPLRQQRIVSQLNASAKLTPEDMQALQADATSLTAAALVPLLTAIPTDNIIIQRAQAQMLEWHQRSPDQLDPALPGAGIFEVSYRHLVEQIVADELGPALTADYLARGDDHHQFITNLLAQSPQSPWWDDVTTPDRETRDTIIRRTLEAMALDLGRHYGDVPHEWWWGRMHTATFIHQPLGHTQPLARLLNRTLGGVPGNKQTIYATGYNYARGYQVTTLPSYRQVLDVGNWDNSRFHHTTGQSGHPFHPHYADMLPLWKSVQLLPMPFTQPAVEAATPDTLQLLPVPTKPES
jgi:penicillin amidase